MYAQTRFEVPGIHETKKSAQSYNLHLPHSLSTCVQTSLTLGNNLIVTLSLSKCHFDLTKLTCKRFPQEN